MAAETQKDIDDLKAQISSLKSDMSNIAESLSRLSGDVVTDGRDRLKQATEDQRRKAKEGREALEREITERPLTSMAAAFGIGFMLAKLLDR